MQAIAIKRWQLVSIGLLVCVLTLGSTVGVVTADPAGVAITTTTVSNDELEPGDTVTITPTVQYASSESGSFEVGEVTVTGPDGTHYARVDNIGVLGSGDTVDVPLQATFETVGDKQLTVHVRGSQYNANGSIERLVHREYPVYVSVSEPPTMEETAPQLHINPQSAVVGAEANVGVVVSNGGDDPIANISLQLTGSTGQIETKTQLQPIIQAHNSSSFQFSIQPSTTGTQTLTATLHYGDGERTIATEQIAVAPAHDDASVYATTNMHNGSTRLKYHVVNKGNRPMTDVIVTGSSPNSALPTATIDRIPPATTETVTATINGQPSGAATISATYAIGTSTEQTEQTVKLKTANQSMSEQMHETNSTTPLSNTPPLIGPGMFLIGGIATAGIAIGYRNWRTQNL